MEDHIILCGLGRVGWHVLELLNAAGTQVVVIDTRCAPDDPRLGGASLVQGDCQKQAILEMAGILKARGVVVLPSDELVSISTALLARRLNPAIRIVVRMFNQNLVARLGSAVSNVVALSTSALAAPLLALIARTGSALGTVRFDDGHLIQIAELTIQDDSSLRGTTLGSLLDGRLQALAHTSGTQIRLLQKIDRDSTLQAGDRLVLCGETDSMALHVAPHEDEAASELQWAGLIRRFGRVAWRTLGEIDLPVKVCTGLLLLVILASTLVFRFGFDNHTASKGLYSTISLMATGGDMGGNQLNEEWQQVFVSIMRLLGLAVTAAFTAILTNYLVRAHLAGALEVRRIPDSGHIVVCGIGNVGFRVVEELLNQGESVVAIERMRDNAFIATARRQGVPVIIGDATVREVLKQARAGSARAVVAATSKELINLEIGLLARELNPKQRVVLLLVDPQLAQTVRQAADVKLAVSIPALAGPAFVAALLGDRVRNVFLVAGKLLAMVDLKVAADNAYLIGQPVSELATAHNFVPIRLCGPNAGTKTQPLNGALAAGDKLTIIIGLDDLHWMLRRETPVGK